MTNRLPTWPVTDGDTAPPTAPPLPVPRSFADEVTDPRGVPPPTADGLAVAPPSFAGYDEEDDDEAPTVIARAPQLGATPAPVQRSASGDRTEPTPQTVTAADQPATHRSAPTGPTPPTRPVPSRPPLSPPPPADPTARLIVAVGIGALLLVVAAGVVLRGLGVW